MSTTEGNKALLLLDRLLTQTESGRLRWEERGDPYTFRARTGQSVFQMASEDRDDVAPFNLQAAHGGAKVATIRSERADSGTIEDAINRRLGVLYRAAKRASMVVGEGVEEVLRDLDALDGEA